MYLRTAVVPFADFVYNLGRILTGFFFPKRCVGCGRGGVWLCRDCSLKLVYVFHQRCLVCGKPAIGGFTHPYCESRYNPERFLCPFRYKRPLRTALCKAKYHGSFALFSDLTLLLSLWLEYSGISLLPGAVLVPVPLHFVRFWERGYNQSLILAELLGRALNLPVDESLLKRVRYTRSQTKLAPEERRKNIKDAFQCSPEVRNKNLILIDDVSTTGATLLEAARTLKHGKARTVWCLTLACGDSWR